MKEIELTPADELLLQQLYKIPFVTETTRYYLDNLMRSEQATREAVQLLREQGFYSLLEIATSVNASNLVGWLSVELYIPWNKQTHARHLYGSCFPEDTQRTVYIDERNCNEKPWLIRMYEFKYGENSRIGIKFFREAILGEKVNGCEIKLSTIYSTPPPDNYYVYSRDILTISCNRS